MHSLYAFIYVSKADGRDGILETAPAKDEKISSSLGELGLNPAASAAFADEGRGGRGHSSLGHLLEVLRGYVH